MDVGEHAQVGHTLRLYQVTSSQIRPQESSEKTSGLIRILVVVVVDCLHVAPARLPAPGRIVGTMSQCRLADVRHWKISLFLFLHFSLSLFHFSCSLFFEVVNQLLHSEKESSVSPILFANRFYPSSFSIILDIGFLFLLHLSLPVLHRLARATDSLLSRHNENVCRS